MSNIQYKVNTDSLAVEAFGNEVVLINLMKGTYYSFRGDVAMVIWEMLQLGHAESDIADAVARQFEVEPQRAKDACHYFIGQLIAEAIILPCEDVAPAQSSPAQDKKPFEAPVLEIYDDLQSMIMLDPVHDADAVKGWPAQKQ